MTRPGKSLLIALAILAVLVTAVNIFLYFGLTNIARNMLPEIRRATGLNIDFDKLRASLPGGRISVTGIKINNPENFSANNKTLLSLGKVDVNIGLLSLPRGIIKLSDINLKESRLTLVKNESGSINAVKVGDIARNTSQGSQPPLPQTETGDTNKATPVATSPAQAIPKVILGHASIQTVLEYIDQSISPEGSARLALALKIRADNITSFGDPDKHLGTFAVKGHIEEKPGSMVIDIKGKIAPLLDPAKPSFEVTGTVTNICTTDFKALADTTGIESEQIDLDIKIQCKNGTYVRGFCFLNAKIKKLTFRGKAAGRKMQDIKIDYLSVSIPLKGTVDAPDIDIIGALTDNIMGNVDKLFRSINVDQKSIDKGVKNFFNSILGGNNKKK